ncbi:hypothetical protein [Actinomadura coerulea]|uniref:hypothetical protein n=1 Tax=Actinomadura coerulea TaxID=46159 RepID=UPI0034397ACB
MELDALARTREALHTCPAETLIAERRSANYGGPSGPMHRPGRKGQRKPEHAIVDGLTSWATAGYADKGYQGAGGAIGTPCKRKEGRKLGKRKKLFNRYHAKDRAVGERGAAPLKQ